MKASELKKELIGDSKAMRKVKHLIEQVAQSKTTVLITGESGTGKQNCAEEIAKKSDRSDKLFVTVDCSILPKGNAGNSELFGHKKGSYTGATEDREGKIRSADGGTIFLDELNSLSLERQANLLRFLQEGEIESLGYDIPFTVNVRVIAATNQDLNKLIEQGTFREDLYHRINVFPIEVPPLRKRKEDIKALSEHLLSKICIEEKIDNNWKINKEHIEILENDDWSGNVRTLENYMRKVIVSSKGSDVLKFESPNIKKKSKLFTVDDLRLEDLPNIIFSDPEMGKADAAAQFVVWLFIHRDRLDHLCEKLKPLNNNRQGRSIAKLKKRLELTGKLVTDVIIDICENNSFGKFFEKGPVVSILEKHLRKEYQEFSLKQLNDANAAEGTEKADQSQNTASTRALYFDIVEELIPVFSVYVWSRDPNVKKKLVPIGKHIRFKIEEKGIPSIREQAFEKLETIKIHGPEAAINIKRIQDTLSIEEVRSNCLYFWEKNYFHEPFRDQIEKLLDQINQGQILLPEVLHTEFQNWFENLEELYIFIEIRTIASPLKRDLDVLIFNQGGDEICHERDELWTSVKVKHILKSCDQFHLAIWKYINILRL